MGYVAIFHKYALLTSHFDKGVLEGIEQQHQRCLAGGSELRATMCNAILDGAKAEAKFCMEGNSEYCNACGRILASKFRFGEYGEWRRMLLGVEHGRLCYAAVLLTVTAAQVSKGGEESKVAKMVGDVLMGFIRDDALEALKKLEALEKVDAN